MAAVRTAMEELYGEPVEAAAAARATWESEALRQDHAGKSGRVSPRTERVDGGESRNKMTLDSRYAFHVAEGGFTQQQMDEMKQAQEEAEKG